METKTTDDFRSKQTAADIARLSTEEKTALLEKTLAEIDQKNWELQIEAALERVRAKAMAMQNSTDVGEAIGIVFSELEKLGIAPLRCGIFIIHEETETMEIWTAISTNEGKVGKVSGWLSVNIHPLLKMAFDAWKQKNPYTTYELAGDDLVNYIKAIAANTEHYKMPTQNIRMDKQTVCAFSFTEGALFTFTAGPPSPDTVSVLQKFASVFGLTYRRYLDLKNAEEQARLAIKQASIDRVRAEIASMRSTEDLQRITPLLWHELNALHVPFVRCGVFIMNERTDTTQAFLASPEGKQLGILNINNAETPLTQKAVDYWQKGLVYTEHWDKEQFINWMQSLLEQKQIRSAKAYQGEAAPPESLHLHFIPFKQGMLYVGNTAPLSDEEIELTKSLSNAFAIAYARYEDFKQLEDAKNKIEATLNELRITQRQLIHSEKMASLGELTAGIAHEIQNPLNFVNNFSEVSKDLIVDVKQAMENDRQDEVHMLLTDISENLEKIAHHGKRADGIVKSMLQHSRKSTGKKTLTDINPLVEEYLRLSYHGLRAKNPGFDATYTTSLDERIEKIPIIPNDIGRVLLNLFNNAFYAVNEKKNFAKEEYKPTVTVTTKKKESFVEISVKDNGNGISKKIINKIYQPFFTTKPTGEGTGLGLSLSYDIVTKGHGGELKVYTKEGEGAEFIVLLPLQQ